ncbi:hypothetical protein HRbin15_01644 [bacterium HR15]|nr:hypothetical protein HRbin15_01644 [bacterium HR15]
MRKNLMWCGVRMLSVALVGWIFAQALCYETRTIQAETMYREGNAGLRLVGSDAEGRYLARVGLSPDQPAASLTVPIRPLPPGNYKFFWRRWYSNRSLPHTITIKLYNSEIGVPPFQVTISNPLAIETCASDICLLGVPISTSYGYDVLRLEFRFSGPSSDPGGYVEIDWVLITDDPNIVIRDNPCRPGEKQFVRLSDPTPPVAIPVGSTNAFPNSSFEAGDIYWMGPYQWDFQAFNAMIDDSRAYHGRRSLKLMMFSERYATRPEFRVGKFGSPELQGFKVQPGHTYTFSFKLYHERSQPIGVYVWAECVDFADQCCPGNGCRQSFSNYYAFSGYTWQEASITFTVPSSFADPIATIGFSVGATDGDAYSSFPVWIDALQIHEGNSPLPYQPAESVVAGVRFTLPGNVAWSGQENTHIRLYVRKESNVAAYFEYKVYDIFDRLISRGQIDLTGLPVGSHDLPINLNAGLKGWFELHYRTVTDPSNPPAFQRTHFSVIPASSGNTLIGGYGSTGLLPLQIYNLSNIRWQNLLSASNFICYWGAVEPTNDNFNLYPHRIQWARDQGIQLIFPLAIGSAASSSVPGWASRGTCSSECTHGCGSPSEPYDPNIHICHRVGGGDYEYFRLADWLDYVRTMVRTYKFHIKYWQVIDEPMTGFSPEEYLKLLRATYQAIKAEDPTAIVLASPHSKMRQLLELEPNLHLYCDGVYEYMRDRSYAYFIRLWAMLYGKRVVSVEYIFQRSGWYDALIGVNYPADIGQFKAYSRQSVKDTILSALQSLAWSGAERYMLYDMRFPGDLRWYTCFEPDGTWKPAGTLVACMNAILSGYAGMDELGTGSTLRAFWFRSFTGSNSLFVVISATDELRWVTLPGTFSFVALDAFGNPALQSGRRILITGLPTYIVVPRANEADVKKALISQSLSKPSPAFWVVGSDMRWADGKLWLVTQIRNQTSWPFFGRAYVFPHWEKKSLYHLWGYTPVYDRAWYASTAITAPVNLPAGSIGEVWLPLEYYDLRKDPDLNFYYPLYFWLVPDWDTPQLLPANEIYSSMFWFQP